MRTQLILLLREKKLSEIRKDKDIIILENGLVSACVDWEESGPVVEAELLL